MYWTLLATALLLAWGVKSLGRYRQTRAERLSRGRSLERIKLLRQLIEQVQRHRGLCFGVMSGESSLDVRRWSQHQEVLSLLDDIREHESALFWYSTWHHALVLWQEIEEKLQQPGASAEQVLLLHNRLIDQLLGTVRGLADKHDLVCFGGLAPQPQGFWLELLNNTELLGQARAIGTGIAARRQNTALQRNELLRLRQQINDVAYIAPARLLTDPQLRPVFSTPVREAEEAIDDLLQMIDRMLSEDLPRVRSAEYFQAATRAISGQLVLVDLLLGRLSDERQDGAPFKQG